MIKNQNNTRPPIARHTNRYREPDKELESGLWQAYCEEQVLGAVMLECYDIATTGKTLVPQTLELLRPEYFHDFSMGKTAFRARIFKAMQGCYEEYGTVEPLTLSHYLKKTEQYHSGDIESLRWIITNTMCSLDAPHYAVIVKENGIKRMVKYYTEKGMMDKAREVLGDGLAKGGYDL